MPVTWTIKANDRAYGPYTLAQMRSYATEGRLAAHSLVARTPDTAYRPASEDLELAPLFRPAEPQPKPQRPVFFTADGDVGQQGFGKSETETQAVSHFVIVTDMKSRSIAGIEEEIQKLGQVISIMPQAWILSSSLTINVIRNALVQKLGRIDTLFIADATRDKAAWFNYGPEADARIRRVWQKSQEMQAAE